MAGGLFNIVAVGNANVILMGTPAMSFFKVAYTKHINFGLQKFRIDYDGLRTLRLTEPSTFQFKIPRYADLLMDTYVSVALPDIFSPIYHPCNDTGNRWVPYDFRWIRHLGTSMIREVSITCGGALLQRYSGAYLAAMVERDFTSEKKELFESMSGHAPELNDPANAFGRINAYPSSYYAGEDKTAEPSIRGRYLYIPLNTWFTLDSRCAFPLVALQYVDLYVNVTFRPIQELFQVRDVFDFDNNYPYVQPDFNSTQFQMHRFLQTPPSPDLSPASYGNTNGVWNADIHLVSTFCFLDDTERKNMALESHAYLVKDVFEYTFENIVGTRRVPLTSSGMVSSWMWFFQRNDAFMRNEWSNYTNWAYSGIMPVDIGVPPSDKVTVSDGFRDVEVLGPLMQPTGLNTGIYITGESTTDNVAEIMQSMGIVLNGDYRETTLESGIFNYVEKYVRTKGHAKNGLYCYQYCLQTDPAQYQPSGAINLSKFKTVEIEFTTIQPTFDANRSAVRVVCDGNGDPIGVEKSNWRLYDYTYNVTVFEERYNVLSIIGGNCAMLYAR